MKWKKDNNLPNTKPRSNGSGQQQGDSDDRPSPDGPQATDLTVVNTASYERTDSTCSDNTISD